MLLAAQRRLRPILMTAVAAIFGMLPLAFAFAQVLRCCSRLPSQLYGGLLLSMLLSLIVTPIVYYMLTRNDPIYESAEPISLE